MYCVVRLSHFHNHISPEARTLMREREREYCYTTLEPTNHRETNSHVSHTLPFTLHCTQPNKCSLRTMSLSSINCQNLLDMHNSNTERETESGRFLWELSSVCSISDMNFSLIFSTFFYWFTHVYFVNVFVLIML